VFSTVDNSKLIHNSKLKKFRRNEIFVESKKGEREPSSERTKPKINETVIIDFYASFYRSNSLPTNKHFDLKFVTMDQDFKKTRNIEIQFLQFKKVFNFNEILKI